MALRYVGDPGSSAALIAVSGGHSGKIADVFGGAGFAIPSPSDSSLEEIASYAELMGGSYRNPFEGPSVRGDENLARTLDVLARDEGIDFAVVEFAAGNLEREPDGVQNRVRVLSELRERHPDFAAVTVLSSDIPYVEGADLIALARPFFDAGLPCFPTMERGSGRAAEGERLPQPADLAAAVEVAGELVA